MGVSLCQYRHAIGIFNSSRATYSGVEQQNVSSVNNSRCSDFSDDARDMQIVLYYIFVYYIFNFLELLALCTIQNDRLSNSKINACYYTYTFLSNINLLYMAILCKVILNCTSNECIIRNIAGKGLKSVK